MSEPARQPPEPVKRAIRQRCGFGCVICGLPIYDYDHIVNWADTHQHDPDEMTLLCQNHHRQKTNDLIPLDVIREANAAPWNLREGTSASQTLYYRGPTFVVDVGSNLFTFSTSDEHPSSAIVIDGHEVIGVRFQDGHALLNVDLVNELDEKVLVITENELTYSIGSWDIEFTGKQLIIRAEKGNIFVDLAFETPNVLRVPRGRITRNGVELQIRPDVLRIVNNQGEIKGFRASGNDVGLSIGPDPQHRAAGFRVRNVRR